MFHLIWYIIIGFISGLIAKSLMGDHLTFMMTVLLGIVGGVVGGFVTHLFFKPKEGAPFHPAGLVFSVIGAMLVLFVYHRIG